MRWKFILPATIFMAAVVLFTVLFLDTFIRRGLVAAGEMAFGAKVSIGSVRTKFRTMSVSIADIAVADRNDPWKNRFQAGSVRFAVRPLPLLSKKVIIDEMVVDGITWGTKRETSGALPRRKERKFKKVTAKERKDGVAAKLMAKVAEKGKTEFQQLPAVETFAGLQKGFEAQSLDKAIDAADLSSLKEMEAMKTGLDQKYKQYEEQLKSLKDSGDVLKEAQAAAEELSRAKVSTPEDAAAFQGKLEAANAAKAKVEARVSELQKLQQNAMTDFGEEKAMLAKIEELKGKDYKALMEKMKLPDLSFSGMSGSIFGPVWVNRVQTALHYVELVRTYMPAKKEKRPVRPRLKGRDIGFPVRNQLPGVLISVARVSGSTGGPGKDGAPLDFKGEIRSMTSDPELLGVPTTALITGSQAGKTMQFNGLVDHTGDVPLEQARASLSGITAQEMNLPTSEYLPSFERGSGRAESSFTMKGGVVDASIELALSGLGAPAAGGTPEVSAFVAGLWAGIDTLSAQARVAGTAEGMDMSVSSNLDKVLSDRMSKLLGASVQEAQKKARAEIDRLTNERKQEVLKEFASKKDALSKQYEERQKELLGVSGSLTSISDAKKKEAQGRLDAEKKKKEQELKDKAAEELKKFFK